MTCQSRLYIAPSISVGHRICVWHRCCSMLVVHIQTCGHNSAPAVCGATGDRNRLYRLLTLHLDSTLCRICLAASSSARNSSVCASILGREALQHWHSPKCAAFSSFVVSNVSTSISLMRWSADLKIGKDMHSSSLDWSSPSRSPSHCARAAREQFAHILSPGPSRCLGTPAKP